MAGKTIFNSIKALKVAVVVMTCTSVLSLTSICQAQTASSITSQAVFSDPVMPMPSSLPAPSTLPPIQS
ncbi:MAG: hypothetical protein R8K20_09580, partial [Gallionellaceae bacterium]